MERDSYIEGIRSAWLGERLGEVFFKALADRAEDEFMRAAWRTLAQLEHATGERMAALLETHGEQAVTREAVEVSDDILERYAGAAHHDSMLRLRDTVEQAIIRFDQLLAVAPEADVPAVQFLVSHEQALLTFADRELAGDHAHALQDVEALLEHTD